MIPRVYIDTSVIGGCLDEEFDKWSKLLFDEFHSGLKIAVVSDLTLRELEESPIATIERVDVLVSWNFKQIVNLDRIRKFNAVNLMRGYHILEIRSPLEVLYGKED